MLSFSLLLVLLVELSNGVYVSLCAQKTTVQLKPQNIVEESQAPYGIKQSPDRFLKHCWLLTVFTNEHHSSHQPAETHKLSDGGRSSPLEGFPFDTASV